jgi:ubiquitin carboxyl-terminal hydrolase L3
VAINSIHLFKSFAAQSGLEYRIHSFIEKNNQIYELDGRKPFPINHGHCSDLLDGACKVIKTFMERDKEALQFTIMALCPNTINQ